MFPLNYKTWYDFEKKKKEEKHQRDGPQKQKF